MRPCCDLRLGSCGSRTDEKNAGASVVVKPMIVTRTKAGEVKTISSFSPATDYFGLGAMCFSALTTGALSLQHVHAITGRACSSSSKYAGIKFTILVTSSLILTRLVSQTV